MKWIEDINVPERFSEYNSYVGNKSTNKLAFGVVYNTLYVMAAEGVLKSKEVQDEIVCKTYLKENFKKFKQVYIVNPDLFNALMKTQDVKKIRAETIDHLPYSSFWLDLRPCGVMIRTLIENISIDGVFVSRENYNIEPDRRYVITPEFECDKNSLKLLVKMSVGNKYELLPLNIPVGYSVEEAVRKDWVKAASSSELKETLVVILNHVIKVVYYLCTKKPDIITRKPRVRPTPPKGPKNKKRKKEKPVTENELGYIIGPTFGAAIVKYQREEDPQEHRKGKKKSPHYRAAHFTTVWTGHGDEKTAETRWIDTIYVNAGDDDCRPTTLHNMV